MAQHGSFAICHQGSAFSSLCSFSFLPETKSCTSGRVQLQRLCHFIDQNQEIISRQHNVKTKRKGVKRDEKGTWSGACACDFSSPRLLQNNSGPDKEVQSE